MRLPEYDGRYPDFCCEGSPVPQDEPGFQPYACTRRAGHKGDHVATIRGYRVIARWPNYSHADNDGG